MGASLLRAKARIIIGCTKYAQYVTLENGYKHVADRKLFKYPPFPVEQAITIQANAMAHAE